MRILAVGDEHRRHSTPVHRIDNYAETQFRKSEEILRIAAENECSIVLYPGDVFDTASIPYSLLVKYMDLHNSFMGNWAAPDTLFGVVWGQHDQRYHTTAHENTPLGALCAGCTTMKPLSATPYTLTDKCGSPVSFYGASWGEEIPEPKTEGVNVLVIHKMVIQTADEKAWQTQTEEEYTLSNSLLSLGYDLVVSGDNHNQFISASLKHRSSLINAGSVMRSTTAQTDHKPAVYVYDTASRKITRHPLTIAPAEKVFNLEVVAETKERDEKMETFVAALRDVKVKTTDFAANLQTYMRDNDIDDAVRRAIHEILPQR